MFSPSGLFYYVLFVCLYFRNWANFVCTQCVVWTFIDSERSIQWNCRAKPSVTLFALVLIATLDTKNTHSLVYYCRKNINYFHHKKRDHQWLKIYNIFSSFYRPSLLHSFFLRCSIVQTLSKECKRNVRKCNSAEHQNV